MIVELCLFTCNLFYSFLVSLLPVSFTYRYLFTSIAKSSVYFQALFCSLRFSIARCFSRVYLRVAVAESSVRYFYSFFLLYLFARFFLSISAFPSFCNLPCVTRQPRFVCSLPKRFIESGAIYFLSIRTHIDIYLVYRLVLLFFFFSRSALQLRLPLVIRRRFAFTFSLSQVSLPLCCVPKFDKICINMQTVFINMRIFA